MEREDDMVRFTEGRLDSAPSALFQEFITRPEILSLRKPGRFAAELTVDLAHTVMLAECGITSPEDAGAICHALKRALQTGQNIVVVSKRLGHASVAITSDIYAHSLPGWQKQTAEAIAAAMEV